MTLFYYSSAKSFGITPTGEDGRKRTFLADSSAYALANRWVSQYADEEERRDKLRFFTQYGKKINVGGIVIESTPTDSFNLLYLGNIVCTFPSQYMQVISAILKEDFIACKQIIENVIGDIANIEEILVHFPSVDTSNPKTLTVHGKYGLWEVNRATMACTLDGRHLCIVCHDIYADLPYTEKEQVIMSKLLVALNEDYFCQKDEIIARQVHEKE